MKSEDIFSFGLGLPLPQKVKKVSFIEEPDGTILDYPYNSLQTPIFISDITYQKIWDDVDTD